MWIFPFMNIGGGFWCVKIVIWHGERGRLDADVGAIWQRVEPSDIRALQQVSLMSFLGNERLWLYIGMCLVLRSPGVDGPYVPPIPWVNLVMRWPMKSWLLNIWALMTLRAQVWPVGAGYTTTRMVWRYSKLDLKVSPLQWGKFFFFAFYHTLMIIGKRMTHRTTRFISGKGNISFLAPPLVWISWFKLQRLTL